jgi:signal peptidase I
VKFDFALLLTVLSAFTGVVWLVDALFFAKSRKLMVEGGRGVPEPVLVDYSRSLFPVLFFVLVLRSFLAEPFRIPSESMMPNLLTGDFILVNKYDYGLRLPVLNRKFLQVGEPKRGDVVVFRYPGRDSEDPQKGTDYIKRVIGLPGDTIEVSDDQVAINGRRSPMPRRRLRRQGRRGPRRHRHRPAARGTARAAARHHGHPRQPLPPGHLGGARRPLFRHGRQPRPQRRQPRLGLRPGGEPGRRAMVIWLNCEGWACSDGFDYSRIGDTIR